MSLFLFFLGELPVREIQERLRVASQFANPQLRRPCSASSTTSPSQRLERRINIRRRAWFQFLGTVPSFHIVNTWSDIVPMVGHCVQMV